MWAAVSFIALLATANAFLPQISVIQAPWAMSSALSSSFEGPPVKGSRVRIKRPESYWYNEVGTVQVMDKDLTLKYPATVKFEKVNYAGVSLTNFGLNEIIEVERPPEKPKPAPKAPPAEVAKPTKDDAAATSEKKSDDKPKAAPPKKGGKKKKN